MRTFNCDDLVGRTSLGCFLRIIKKVADLSKSNIKFMVNDENNMFSDQIMSILAFAQRNQQGQEDTTAYRFQAITVHQGSVQVAWKTGETTYEPLVLIAKDDSITYAKYAKDLRNKVYLKLKGDLGCEYHKDPDGTLVADPK
jgi:hypothetical protein